MAVTPCGQHMVMVRKSENETRKDECRYWKIPGGTEEENDLKRPGVTAARELLEEGLHWRNRHWELLTPAEQEHFLEKMTLFKTVRKGVEDALHLQYLFVMVLPIEKMVRTVGMIDGEDVTIMEIPEILTRNDILNAHREHIEEVYSILTVYLRGGKTLPFAIEI